MAVGSAISSPLGPASCDKDAKFLQFIEETTRNADLVQERVLPGSFKSRPVVITDGCEDLQPEIQRIVNGGHSRFVLITGGSFYNCLPSVNLVKAVSYASVSKACHGVSTSIKALLGVGEPIYKALDFLLNRRGGGGGGGEGGDGEEGDVQGGDGEEGDVEGGDGEEGDVEGVDGEEGDVEGVDGEEGDVEGVGGDKKKSRPTPEMLKVIATTTIANTAQTFGSAISLKVRDLALARKVLLILVMANGLAGYLFSITAILLMHKRPRFSRVLVWTGCASTTLGFLIFIAAFVLEL